MTAYLPTARYTYRSIFISDFHIGAKAFNEGALLDFLRKTESEYLYLVGDIIDGWKMDRRWYWTETINQIFDELFRKAHAGTKIIYITGNHDERVRDLSFLRRLKLSRRLDIRIKNRTYHETADGRKFLVMHGDQFDRAILRGPLLRWIDRVENAFLDLFFRKKPLMIKTDNQIKRFSLSKFLTYHSHAAINILTDFENGMLKMALKKMYRELFAATPISPV